MNQALAVGGAPRRVVRLRVIGGGHVDLRDDVPATMADCPTERSATGHIVCGHVRCEFHLWLVEGRDRPGRWRNRIGSELRPAWLEWPLPPACADDLAKQERTVPEKARAIGLGTTRFHNVVADALRKLEEVGGDELRELAGEDLDGQEDEAGVPIPKGQSVLLAALKARR
jgi:hypothetical protein